MELPAERDFSLKDRLEMAKEQRRIAAGLPPSIRPDAVMRVVQRPPEPPSEMPNPDDALARLVIDLGDPASLLAYAPEAAVTAPAPAVAGPAGPGLPTWQGGEHRAGALRH